MKARIVFTALSLMMVSDVAVAQSNPFAPRSNGGLTRAQIEQIARQEYQAQQAQRESEAPPPVEGAPGAPGTPAAPGAPVPATGTIPSQPGGPSGSPIAGSAVSGAAGVTAVVEAGDPVAALISDGGAFVGCARNVPIFRDKVGRRIYFTTKELKASEATRRYARC